MVAFPYTRPADPRPDARPLPTVRYCVIEGIPFLYPGPFQPETPHDFPEHLELQESETVGEFATLDEALAESARINRAAMMTRPNPLERTWAIVVVRQRT